MIPYNDKDTIKISIDFDKTFTAAPVLWSNFIKTAHLFGHTVVCITARYFTQENVDELKSFFKLYDIEIPLYFSNHGSKKEYAIEHCLHIDIWIDDCPEAIVLGV